MVHLIAGLGGALVFVAQVWLAVLAFRKGVIWGLAVLCIPFVALVFVFLNWSETKVPAVLYVAGVLMSGAGASQLRGSLGRGAVIEARAEQLQQPPVT